MHREPRFCTGLWLLLLKCSFSCSLHHRVLRVLKAEDIRVLLHWNTACFLSGFSLLQAKAQAEEMPE